MAVPVNPTPTLIVTQALKRAGRTTPTAAQITEAIDYALQEVKADIMLVAATHPNLLASSTTVTTRGQSRYAVPDDFNEQLNILLMDGPDDWRGTAQGGGSSTITLAASTPGTAEDLIGKNILITSGPGVEEYRAIINYDSATKIATVDSNWVVNPASNSTYLVEQERLCLYPNDTAADYDLIQGPTYLQRPISAALFGQEFILFPTPDKSTYGLLNRYWVDLSKLDETGTLFTQLLREWRSVWTQGVAVKSMQRFDEDRYQLELAVYKSMLDALASQSSTVRQVRFYDHG